MGLSILGPGGSTSLPVSTTPGIGPADIVATIALIYVLSYLYLVDPLDIAAERKSQLTTSLLAAAVPLLGTFLGVVLFTSVSVA